MSGDAPKADALPGCAIPRHAELLGFSLVSPRVSTRTKAEYQGERGMNLRTFPGIVPESVRVTFGPDALTYGGWKVAENSGIEWTHHTYNPWIGCTRVSAACDHCYAEAWDRRGLQTAQSRWGAHATRTKTKTRPNLRKWDNKARELGVRYRVFCASLADIGDNHKSIAPEWRRELVSDIRAFGNLDFLLLTKRPQNIAKLYPDLMEEWPENAWMGASTENRDEMLRRGAALAELPAKITFWSAEPLVGDLGIIPPDIMPSWVIAGGESGPDFRSVNPDWFRSIRDQCAASGVPFLFKQWEGRNQKEIKALGRELDGVVHDGYPTTNTTAKEAGQ